MTLDVNDIDGTRQLVAGKHYGEEPWYKPWPPGALSPAQNNPMHQDKTAILIGRTKEKYTMLRKL